MPTEKDFLLNNILSQFDLGNVQSISKIGTGHINYTYLIECAVGKFILQEINTSVFKNPDEVMHNIFTVTEHIEKKGGTALSFLKTHDGKRFLKDDDGRAFRVYRYVENSICLEGPRTKEDFYKAAVSFGKFQKMLSDLPAGSLFETIKDFHNMPDRFRKFKESVEKNAAKRRESVKEEIAFFTSREDFANTLEKAKEDGRLPLRIVHNDTKMSNILFDKDSGEAVCVIDLDTVMPGVCATDFGDSIRSGAASLPEGESDISHLDFSLEMFEIYLKGYLEGCGDVLTRDEILLLPDGAKIMAFECGLRALTDYLDGDVYYNIKYPTQNLDRAKNQIRLLTLMEQKEDKMRKIVEKYL